MGSKDTEDICLDTGHIDIYVSSKFQAEFASKIASWLKERDRILRKKAPRQPTLATGKTAATRQKPPLNPKQGPQR